MSRRACFSKLVFGFRYEIWVEKSFFLCFIYVDLCIFHDNLILPYNCKIMHYVRDILEQNLASDKRNESLARMDSASEVCILHFERVYCCRGDVGVAVKGS